MRILLLLTTFLIFSSQSVLAVDIDYSISDEHLETLPKSVFDAIKLHQSLFSKRDFSHCEVAGKSVGLNGHSLWFVTTQGECADTGLMGPIWLVTLKGQVSSIVLETDQFYSLRLKSDKNSDFPTVVTSTGTASEYSDTTWEFVNGLYKKSKSRVVNLRDEKSCKKNPDVCGSL